MKAGLRKIYEKVIKEVDKGVLQFIKEAKVKKRIQKWKDGEI
jgi:hypothetical protein